MLNILVKHTLNGSKMEKKYKIKEEKRPAKKLITMKVSVDDYEIMKKNAKKYAKGNLSHYVRYCTIHLRPHPQDLEEIN